MLVRVERTRAVTKLLRFLKAINRSEYLEWGCLYSLCTAISKVGMAVLGSLSSQLHECFKSGLYLKRDPGLARPLAAQSHPGLYASSFGLTAWPKKPAQA